MKHFLNNNEMSLNFNLYDSQSHQITESNKTKDIKAIKFGSESINSDFVTTDNNFEWNETEVDKLVLSKKFCWADLKKSYMSVYVNETKYIAEHKAGALKSKKLSVVSSKNLLGNACASKKNLNILEYFKEEEDKESSDSDDSDDSLDYCNAKPCEIEEESNKVKDYFLENKSITDKLDKYTKKLSKNNINVIDLCSSLSNVSQSGLDSIDNNQVVLKKEKNSIKNVLYNTSSTTNNKFKHAYSTVSAIIGKLGKNKTLTFDKRTSESYNKSLNLNKKESVISVNCEEEQFYNFNKQYNKHGVIEIHFNEILEEKDIEITKQSSNIFESFSTFNKVEKKVKNPPTTPLANHDFILVKNIKNEINVEKLHLLKKISTEYNELKFSRRNTLNLELYNSLENFHKKLVKSEMKVESTQKNNSPTKNDSYEIDYNVIDLRKKSSKVLDTLKLPGNKKNNIVIMDNLNDLIEDFSSAVDDSEIFKDSANKDNLVNKPQKESEDSLSKQKKYIDSFTRKTVNRRATTHFLSKINIENCEHLFDKNVKLYKINNKKRSPALNNDNANDDNDSSVFISVYGFYKKKIIDNVYYKGQIIGTIELEISIKNIPMIKQIQCGVHTEKGFDITSIFIAPKINKSTTNLNDGPKEITELKELFNIIIQRLTENLELKTIFSQRENTREIKAKLRRIEELLKKSSKESTLIYEYNNHLDLLSAQELIIKFVKKVVNFLDSVNIELKQKLLECIQLICDRGELDLNMMIIESSLAEKYVNIINQESNDNNILSQNKLLQQDNLSTFKAETENSDHKNLNSTSEEQITYVKRKVEVAGYFFNMCLILLEFCLENIPRKVHDEVTKDFNEYIMSFIYFKLNKFQEAFLDTIAYDLYCCSENRNLTPIKKNNLSERNFKSNAIDSFKSPKNKNNLETENDMIKHIKELNNLMDECEDNNRTTNPVITIINWDLLFFERFKAFSEFNYQEKMERLDKILSSNFEWRDKLKKRGLAFYSIVLQLKNYINKKVVVSRNIRWKDIQGFSLILDCIYYDLSIKEAKNISNSCINLMKSFINDSRIMNKFINIIITKTNVNDTSSVLKIFDILDAFFHEYEFNKSISSFKYKVDYNLIHNAITIILNNDNYLCISKVFWFFYHNAHLINLDPLSKIIKLIFKEKFYYLFFHWAYQVRNFFYYFILFIINHKLKNNVNNCFGIEGNEELVNRRRQILLEKVIEQDPKGFQHAIKKDYLKQIRTEIMNEFYEKLRVIVLIGSQIKKFKKRVNNELNKDIQEVKYNNNNIDSVTTSVKYHEKLDLDSVKIGNDSQNSIDLEVRALSFNPKKRILFPKSRKQSSENDNVHLVKRNSEIEFKSRHFYELELKKFIFKNKKLSEEIKDFNTDYLVIGVEQYLDLEEQFKIWEKEIKNDDSIVYPAIELFRVKDDVFDISNDEY